MATRFHEAIETAGLWAVLVGMVAFCLFSGCSVKLNDNGSVFMRFGTTIEFGHETSTTNASSEATGHIASEFMRAIGLWKEKGEITDADLLEALRLLAGGDSVPLAMLLAADGTKPKAAGEAAGDLVTDGSEPVHIVE